MEIPYYAHYLGWSRKKPANQWPEKAVTVKMLSQMKLIRVSYMTSLFQIIIYQAIDCAYLSVESVSAHVLVGIGKYSNAIHRKTYS